MVILEQDRRLAAGMYRVVVGQVARLADERTRTLAEAALSAPGPITIRALLTAGASEPWLSSVRDALAEVGIAAAEDVLGGGDD